MPLALPNTFRARLALNVINDHFGDIVRDAAHLIMSMEQCTLQGVVRAASVLLEGDQRLSPKAVRFAFLVLLKHHCLVVELPHDLDLPDLGGDVSAIMEAKLSTTGLLYKVDVDAVLHRLRHGRLLRIVRDRFSSSLGDLPLRMMEEVILHGRLRYGDLQKLLEQQQQEEEEGVEGLQRVFEELVRHRFLVALPPLDVKRRQLADQEIASKGGRKPPSVFDSVGGAAAAKRVAGIKRSRDALSSLPPPAAATSSATDSFLPVELRLMMQHEETEWQDPSAPPAPTPTTSSTTAGRGGGGRNGSTSGGRGRGRGRGRGVASSSSNNHEPSTSASNGSGTRGAGGGGDSSIVRADAYWMVGTEQLIREERHRACISAVAEHLEQLAADVVRAILSASMSLELGPRPAKSNALGLHEIYRLLQVQQQQQQASGEVGKDLSLETVKRLVEVMRLSSLQALLKVAGSDGEATGPLFVVNYEAILASLRRRTIHRIASGRYGVYSARIVELLHVHKYLEQQAVADRAILPARETRERLYRLFRDRWLGCLELSKRGDFSPASSCYFWYLDMPRLREAVLEHLFKAIYNVRLRRESELAKSKDLLELVQTSTVLSAVDQTAYENLLARLHCLEATLYRLDHTLLLMDQF